MRQHVATLVSVAALGGCSLIYNAGDITEQRFDAPPVDAPPDLPIADVNPALLELISVTSPDLLEGQGDGGSVPAVLVVTGHHIKFDAVITVAPTTANAAVTVETGERVVAIDGDWIGVPVIARVMETIGEASGVIELTVTVTQTGASQVIPWRLRPLDELTGASVVLLPPLKDLYSKVAITGTVQLKGAGAEDRGVIRAVSSLAIGGAVTATTDLTADPGPESAVAGGCSGGLPGSPGGCTGGGGGGTNGGGGGGGFVLAGSNGLGTMGVGAGGIMHGDPLISSYGSNAGAGGGGGAGGLGAGGAGGASGGTVELTAGGNLSIAAVTMNGAGGESAGALSGASAGGGGSGGVIVVRSAGTVTSGALSAIGGDGGPMPAAKAGGAGAAGRIRIDAIAAPVASSTPVAHRGLILTPHDPPITRVKQPTITVSGTTGDQYDVYVNSGNDQFTLLNKQLLSATATVMPTLFIGYNQICVVPKGINVTTLEARTCIELGYLP